MRPIVLTQTGAGTTQAAPLDIHGRPEISLQVGVTGTVNFTVQQTLDNPFDSSITPVWLDHPDANLVGATADVQGNYAFVPAAVRLVVNSGAGTARLTIVQSGILG
jgi:hypothetical protein